MVITAKEIKRQAGRLNEQVEHLDSTVRTMNCELEGLANRIESEDSSLANSIIKLRNSLEKVNRKISKNFTEVASVMDKYAKETKENEEIIKSDLSKINNRLQEIISSLNSMNI